MVFHLTLIKIQSLYCDLSGPLWSGFLLSLTSSATLFCHTSFRHIGSCVTRETQPAFRQSTHIYVTQRSSVDKVTVVSLGTLLDNAEASNIAQLHVDLDVIHFGGL